MYSVLIFSTANTAEQLAADLWESETTGIVEEENGQWRAFFPSSDSIDRFTERWPDVVLEVREEELCISSPLAAPDDEPIFIGSRFVVVSASSQTPESGRLQLVVNSVTAFGTGRHESTQMVLELLETLVKGGEAVVDVGCGSGILSEACRLLAPVQVIACDIDESAIQAVRSQFDFPLFLGSVDALPDCSADLVLANISKKAVDALASEIKRVLKPEGHVVVGGFIRDHVPAAYRPVREMQRGDWRCWLCTREGIDVPEQAAGIVLKHPLHWW